MMQLWTLDPPSKWQAGTSGQQETPFYFSCAGCGEKDATIAGIISSDGTFKGIGLVPAGAGLPFVNPAMFCGTCFELVKAGGKPWEREPVKVPAASSPFTVAHYEGKQGGHGPISRVPGGIATVIAWLDKANADSIRTRYPHHPADAKGDPIDRIKAEVERWRFNPPPVLVILKAIQSYEYQSCEAETWDESDAKRWCLEATAFLISELPGYDEAPGWAFDSYQLPIGRGSRENASV